MTPTVSVRDVAAHAGVSVGTVSNVLNHPEKVLDSTVARVRNSIEELGFTRNDAARQLRAGRSALIGLVVFQSSNPFFAEVARGADEAAARAGFTVLHGNSDRDPDRESTYLDVFEQQRVHGVLLAPAAELEDRGDRLRRRGIPLVLVDRDGGGRTSSVAVDDVTGGQLAVEHLLAIGRRRIAFVSARPELRQVADRLDGARRAVAAHPGASLEILSAQDLDPSGGQEAGAAILARASGDRPDGVFTVNDLVAIGLIHTLLAGGVGIPEDIAVVGYDDIDFAADAIVPLTSVRRPSRIIGSRAMDILLEEADDHALAPRSLVFQPVLVERSSTLG